MGRHFAAGPRGGLPYAERERRESDREYYQSPQIAVGRFVMVQGTGETLYEYRDRVEEENKDKRGLHFADGPLFAPLFRPEEFQAIVEDSRTGQTKPAMRRTQYQRRSAKKQVVASFRAASKADFELASMKAERVRFMVESGEVDLDSEDAVLLSEDPTDYQKWGEQTVGLRPQPRLSDPQTIGFAIQLTSHLDSANSQAVEAMRLSGLSRGLALNPPSGSQIIDLMKSDRPMSQSSIEERPILPRPPATVVLGPLVITEL